MSQVQRAPAVETLFPRGLIAFEIRGGASAHDMFPAEGACVARAVEKRVREFAAGRLCARAGLAALGFPPTPLLKEEDRTPAWPSGVVGSITHTDSYCVAVVGRAAEFAGIGVDAEDVRQVTPSIWPSVLRGEELTRLQSLAEDARQQMATIMFSAKEAFYKCQYAFTRSWLGFEDVVVEIAGDAFELVVIDETRPISRVGTAWRGRFHVDGALVVTAIAAGPRGARIGL